MRGQRGGQAGVDEQQVSLVAGDQGTQVVKAQGAGAVLGGHGPGLGGGHDARI